MSLAASLERALGAGVTALRPVSGGDINEAFAATLADGRTVFVKTHARAPEGMFAAEAAGLRWLAEARALRVPAVIAVSEPHDAHAFLVLEHIATGKRGRDFDERLGHGLAALHRAGAPFYGLDHDNFIGRLPQRNARASPDDWATFYRQRRLEPQVKMGVDAGVIPRAMRASFDRLFAALPTLVGPAEPPARLHGDLWAGNHLCDEAGAPVLIDPAVYGGHREVDLAMMRLFGGYGSRVFAAYDEAYPLADGHAERVPLYQLYFLLVHVNLFGGSYLGQTRAALEALV